MLEWLENTQFAVWIRTELWGWPLVLTLHVFGTALVIGFIFIICLRLFGLFALLPYSALNRLFPVIWVGLALQFLTGFVLWMTKPVQYLADGAFLLKGVLVIIGVILTLSLYRTLQRAAASRETSGTVPSHGVFVAVTLLVWCGVIVASRLTAHLGSI